MLGQTSDPRRYGHDLIQRERWGQNMFRMSVVDIGKPLPEGILQQFVAVMHRGQNLNVRMRFQIWYPVDENRGTYRLDYEQVVDVPPSNGEFTVRIIIQDIVTNEL